MNVVCNWNSFNNETIIDECMKTWMWLVIENFFNNEGIVDEWMKLKRNEWYKLGNEMFGFDCMIQKCKWPDV